MNYWQQNIDTRIDSICDRSIDQVHQDIVKKHNQRLDFFERNKLKNLVALRPPTKRQIKILERLNSKEVGSKLPSVNIDLLRSIDQDKPLFHHFTPKKYEGLQLLDTLALLRTHLPAPEKKQITDNLKSTLRKRAAAKHHTLQYLKPLIKLNSPLKNSYCNSLTCSESVISKDGQLHSAYCKNRWCQVCNRIKTANLINGYQPELDKIENKKFVTISYANVSAEQLPEALKHYSKWWRHFYLSQMDKTKKVRRLLLQANRAGDYDAIQFLSKWYDEIKLKGIKKLECTYNAILDNYHPHLHVLVNGEEYALQMMLSWLTYCTANNLKVDDQAQKIEEVDSNICKELFKYFSKIASSTGKTSKGKREKKIFIHALDIMFLAMRGYQVFTAFGLDKIVDEDHVKAIYEDNGLDDVWLWRKNDWVNTKKEKLSGYKPSKYEMERRKYIVYDKKYQLKARMPKKFIEKIEGTTYYIKEIISN